MPGARNETITSLADKDISNLNKDDTVTGVVLMTSIEMKQTMNFHTLEIVSNSAQILIF
jgi:hypothetical protein